MQETGQEHQTGKSVSIYIDTSIRGPGRGPGECIYILSYQSADGRTADMGDRIRRQDTTANQLAILGLEAALKHLNMPCRLTLYLENPYVQSVLQNEWYLEWRCHGWMSAKARPVRDAEIWQSIEALLSVHRFEALLKQHHPYRKWMRGELLRGGMVWKQAGAV